MIDGPDGLKEPISRLNRRAFEKVIAGDLAWLLEQERTLERDHIELVLREAADLHYGRELTAAKLEGADG